MQAFWKRLRLTLDMIKFEHSIFALPFALTGALLAWRDAQFQIPGLALRFVWIVVAMVGARSAAMAFNRILDADIDARNRRTASRHLPAGLLSRRFAWGFTIVSSLVFLWAARELGTLCLLLAPVVLSILFFYSFCKRFTTFSHVVLGFCLGMAPAGAWIAMRGSLDLRILWLPSPAGPRASTSFTLARITNSIARTASAAYRERWESHDRFWWPVSFIC